MTLLLSIFTSDILPIFLVAGVGFLLARWLNVRVPTLAHVTFYALLPCLVFKMLVTSRLPLQQFWQPALLAVMVAGTMGLLAALIVWPWRLDRPHRSAFLLAVIFSNGGNYGLPVLMFAFGGDVVSYGTIYFLTGSVLTFSIGAFLAAAGRMSARNALIGIFKMPSLYGLTAAMIVLLTGAHVPEVVMRPIGLLSDAALPLMILVLGMQLQHATIPKRPWLVAAAVTLSLVVAPFVALTLTSVMHVTGPARQAIVVLASMPVAVVTTILALEFDTAPEFLTTAVVISTLLSPFTLTLVIAYLR